MTAAVVRLAQATDALLLAAHHVRRTWHEGPDRDALTDAMGLLFDAMESAREALRAVTEGPGGRGEVGGDGA
ncbi:MAG: hypothetical protein QN123_14610 [Armatimonadota bacterium]|nr:hypothetical protein [Armatimonadota bacterium]